MQPGEVLVALLSGGATVVRFQEETASRVSVALGRNKQARVPADRIILATGVIASAQEQFEEFRSRALEMSSEIDLSEVWEVLADDAEAIGLEKLGELYWASPPDAPRLVALALHLDRGIDLFALGQDGFVPRSRLEVEETSARRRREAENALEAEALASSLGRGTLPEPVTNHQETLLEILRGYAVYGEDFPRRGRRGPCSRRWPRAPGTSSAAASSCWLASASSRPTSRWSCSRPASESGFPRTPSSKPGPSGWKRTCRSRADAI